MWGSIISLLETSMYCYHVNDHRTKIISENLTIAIFINSVMCTAHRSHAALFFFYKSLLFLVSNSQLPDINIKKGSRKFSRLEKYL